MEISQLDIEIATLSPKIDQNGIAVVRSIQEAYQYYKRTGRLAGLVELTLLLEDEEVGWLPEVIRDPLKWEPERFKKLIARLGDIKGAQGFVSTLDQFRITRNKIHRAKRRPSREEIEKAFKYFLNFARWYYKAYHNLASINDIGHYERQLKAGDKIGERFKVLEYLGGDQDSQNYKALDLESSDNHPIVIKHPLITSIRYCQIVENEKKSRIMFNGHPNIGEFYSSHELTPVGEILKLEYIDGETFREWVKKVGFDAKGISDLLYIVGRVLDGLKYVHFKNYVHGGISPDSILITSQRNVKIVSFDYCCPAMSPISTDERMYRQDDRYVPSKITRRAKDQDTYALGVLMKEVLTGKNIPHSLELFIEKACAAKPGERYQDAAVMSTEWQTVYQELRYRVPGADEKTRKIGLISCTRRKKPYLCAARELYSESERFAKSLAIVENPANGYEKNFIISARYGLVELDQQLAPYDCDLLEFPSEEQECWAGYVVQLLQWRGIDAKCEIVVHADGLYSSLLIKALANKGIKAEQGAFN